MAVRRRILLLHPDAATAAAARRRLETTTDAEVHAVTRPRHAFLVLRRLRVDLLIACEEACEAGLSAFFLEARRLNPRIGRCLRWEEAAVAAPPPEASLLPDAPPVAPTARRGTTAK